MHFQTLVIATGAGLGLQLFLVIAGHYAPFIRNNVFAVGGMGISLLAGAIYGWMAAQAWGPSMIGGLVAGGVCAVLGIAVSVALKDTPVPILAFGSIGSAVAGLVGGALGKWLA